MQSTIKVAIALHSGGESYFADPAVRESFRMALDEDSIVKALGIPFLMINMGDHGKAHRVIGPVFGSCMLLCVQQYTPNGHKEKPLLRACRDIYNNFDY